VDVGDSNPFTRLCAREQANTPEEEEEEEYSFRYKRIRENPSSDEQRRIEWHTNYFVYGAKETQSHSPTDSLTEEPKFRRR
jgi:hypothetical protein